MTYYCIIKKLSQANKPTKEQQISPIHRQSFIHSSNFIAHVPTYLSQIVHEIRIKSILIITAEWNLFANGKIFQLIYHLIMFADLVDYLLVHTWDMVMKNSSTQHYLCPIFIQIFIQLLPTHSLRPLIMRRHFCVCVLQIAIIRHNRCLLWAHCWRKSSQQYAYLLCLYTGHCRESQIGNFYHHSNKNYHCP